MRWIDLRDTTSDRGSFQTQVQVSGAEHWGRRGRALGVERRSAKGIGRLRPQTDSEPLLDLSMGDNSHQSYSARLVRVTSILQQSDTLRTFIPRRGARNQATAPSLPNGLSLMKYGECSGSLEEAWQPSQLSGNRAQQAAEETSVLTELGLSFSRP